MTLRWAGLMSERIDASSGRMPHLLGGRSGLVDSCMRSPVGNLAGPRIAAVIPAAPGRCRSSLEAVEARLAPPASWARSLSAIWELQRQAAVEGPAGEPGKRLLLHSHRQRAASKSSRPSPGALAVERSCRTMKAAATAGLTPLAAAAAEERRQAVAAPADSPGSRSSF